MEPICPEWWPLSLWRLHFTPLPHLPHGGGWGPVNYPPSLDSILNSLLIHTSSYKLLDKEAAKKIREIAVKTIIADVQKMDKLHDEAIAAKEVALANN